MEKWLFCPASMRFASLAQPERRSERLSAFEIMMRVSPSVQYVGAEPWKATPRPSSRDGRLLSDGRSLYELHTARIWRERMHALATDRAYATVDSVSKMARMIASPALSPFCAPWRP